MEDQTLNFRGFEGVSGIRHWILQG
jgi:hypothetical protein